MVIRNLIAAEQKTPKLNALHNLVIHFFINAAKCHTDVEIFSVVSHCLFLLVSLKKAAFNCGFKKLYFYIGGGIKEGVEYRKV